MLLGNLCVLGFPGGRLGSEEGIVPLDLYTVSNKSIVDYCSFATCVFLALEDVDGAKRVLLIRPRSTIQNQVRCTAIVVSYSLRMETLLVRRMSLRRQ